MSDDVLAIVNRSNQRGGRMLSVIDLIVAGTLTRELCAWTLEHVLEGGSWVVGAKPGGAGKTTIMSAILTMLPSDSRMHITNPGTGWQQAQPGDCVVSYEISPGAYDGYIWGEDVRRLTELALSGCRVVTNLHADTLHEARSQVVDQCGATEAGLGALGLFVPIRTAGGLFNASRRVEKLMYHSDDEWQELAGDLDPSPRQLDILGFLKNAERRRLRSCEQVRAAWLQWLSDNWQ
ncbi:MAG: hypothetical protein GF331_21645 [Chitinivibrionales bacterium]|nr:hypothetical protein [Chitinivibrionales bacterium]